MADLGIEVNLKPKINTADFEAALKGINKEISLEINKQALQSSINQAINSIHTNKIKLEIDKIYLASQVKQALSSVNIDVKDFGTAAKNTKNTTSTKAPDWSMTAKQIASAQRNLYTWEKSIERMQKSGVYSKSATKSFNQQLAQIKQMEAGTEQWAQAYEKLNLQYTKAQ